MVTIETIEDNASYVVFDGGTDDEDAVSYTHLDVYKRQPVVLIGAGGAARAVLFALARAKVGHVTILNLSLIHI